MRAIFSRGFEIGVENCYDRIFLIGVKIPVEWNYNK